MRKERILIGVCLAFMLAMNLVAQSRPHDQIMKDINATFTALKKNIDSSTAAAVQQDALKLSRLFEEVEVFWTPLRSKSALEAAKGVQTLAADVANAARTNDLKRADALYTGIGKSCKGCHDRHRVQMPDKTFKIRP
jgi:cytochrome c556